MYSVLIIMFGLFIQQRHASGIENIYLSKNICKIDGYHVDVNSAISILYTRSYLNCVTACFQHLQCESVIFDKSTHYCQLNRELLLPENLSSCGDLIYLQLFTESPSLSSCCSANENFSTSGSTTLEPQEQTTSGPSFTFLPSVGMSVYIGPKTQNIFVASAKCHQMGGELVTLNTLEKHYAVQDYIYDTAPDEEKFYIGLVSKLFGWQWADGTSLNYYNWGSPPKFLQTCAVIDKNLNYEWAGNYCLDSLAYICEQK